MLIAEKLAKSFSTWVRTERGT